MDNETNDKQKGWRRFSRLKVEKGTIKRRARKIENATLKHAHRFLIRRWTNVRDVGRHTTGWLILVGLLIGLAFVQANWFADAYTVLVPADGGTYAEGVAGRLDTMNPLFAKTPAELSASKLIFSSLLSYDRDGQLRSEVASAWTISQEGKVYTVDLRDDVYWHDGVKLTADDVVFTTRLIQDESVRAVQYRDLAAVKVEKKSPTQVQFTLPSVFAPFANSLTFGILPQHILKDVRPSDLRENNFGRKPIGSGPFSFKQIQLIDPSQNRLIVHMEANDRYYKGTPGLNRFQLHTYENRDSLEKALVLNEINAALGLDAARISEVDQQADLTVTNNPLSNGMFALYNNDRPAFKDVQVRQALLLAVNRAQLIEKINGRGDVLEGPLPKNFVPGETAAQAGFDIKAAAGKLDAAGWKLSGLDRQKDGEKLEITVVAPDNGDYKVLLEALAVQWRALGISVKTELARSDSIVTDYLQPRAYDVLIYELAIGADPDVYAYWHSSQANAKGLNFANYRSVFVDDALSGARGKLDRALRLAKYKAFYEQWLKDIPAIALYQPLLSYTTSANTTSLDSGEVVVDISARYRDVSRWAVSQTRAMTTR